VRSGRWDRGILRKTRRRPTRTCVRRHERVWGLPACLGAAVPGQRLAGRLGGRCQSELGQTQAEGEFERDDSPLGHHSAETYCVDD